MIRILLLVDCANDFDRNLLRGIVRYSRENGPWLFYRLPSYYRSIENGERSILEWAKAWKADAIIGQWNDDAMDLLKELNIPGRPAELPPPQYDLFESDRRLRRHGPDGGPFLCRAPVP